MDLVDDGMDYGQISETVRRYSAERMYTMIQILQPHMENLFDGNPGSMGFMEPVRIGAQVQVARLYLSTLKELGGLYRVAHAPVVVEDPEPMIPAADVPLMIEAAVSTAVELAVEQVRMEEQAVRAERKRLDAQEARARLDSALVRIRARSA